MHARIREQRGATLVIALVMLLMITLMVVGAMSLSLTNLKVAGNTQFRSEATAAANLAIEQVIASNFTASPQAQTITVDINKDGTADYTVAVAKPACISIRLKPNSELVLPGDAACIAGGSMGLGPNQSLCAQTQWEITATVQDGNFGAVTSIHQGVAKTIEFTAAQNECL